MPIIPTSEYYRKFVEDDMVKLSFFEKLCKKSYRYLKIPAPGFIKKMLDDHIYLSGMKASSDEVFSLTLSSFLLSLLVFLPIALIDFPSTVIFMVFPPFIAYNALTYPVFHSEVIRIRAGNETVSIILYMITYLSLSPVYDKAVEFTASCCHGPIGNDLKKVIWDVAVGKYTTIKEGVSSYSKKWSLWNEEFVNSLMILQVIELQSTQEGINEILKRAIDRIMANAHTKMEEYAFKLKMPSTMLMLFGIFMPLIGLVMFPMISIFLTASVNPIYIGIGYTVFLPFFMWWILYRMIAKRPATYSHSEKIEEVEPKRYIEIRKLGLNIPIIPLAILIGFLITIPAMMYFLELVQMWSAIYSQYPEIIAQAQWREFSLTRYESGTMMNDTFRAMFLPWGVAISIIIMTYFRSKGPYELDQFIRQLEVDFSNGLFELQSALYQNISIESAILKVVDQYKLLRKEKTPMAIFFTDLHLRIVKLGSTISNALFGKEGLVRMLPSAMIKNILAIVVNALPKGSVTTSSILKNIVSYLASLEEIEHTIKAGMRDIVSNLSMQASFIAPFISGIVASSAVVIIQLLQAMAKAIQAIEKMYSFGSGVGSTMSETLSFIDFRNIMPPTIMEIIAGIYLIEIVVITCIFVTGIDRGFNKVHRDHMISRYMIMAILLFSFVFFTMVVMFQPIIKTIKV